MDSRELRGGDPLWLETQKASAYAVVVSPSALQSDGVAEEIAHVIKLRKGPGVKKYPVIPLSLNGTKLGTIGKLFGKPPKLILVSGEPGGIDTAINPILEALGKRLPADVAPTPQPKAEPLEERRMDEARQEVGRNYRMFRPVRLRHRTVEDLGHPCRHQDGHRQSRRRRRGEVKSHRLPPCPPPRRQ